MVRGNLVHKEKGISHQIKLVKHTVQYNVWQYLRIRKNYCFRLNGTKTLTCCLRAVRSASPPHKRDTLSYSGETRSHTQVRHTLILR